MDWAAFSSLLQDSGHIAQIAVAFLLWRLDRRVLVIETEVDFIQKELKEIQ